MSRRARAAAICGRDIPTLRPPGLADDCVVGEGMKPKGLVFHQRSRKSPPDDPCRLAAPMLSGLADDCVVDEATDKGLKSPKSFTNLPFESMSSIYHLMGLMH